VRTFDSIYAALRKVAERHNLCIPDRSLRRLAGDKCDLQLQKRYGLPDMPSQYTLYRWIRAYIDHEYDERMFDQSGRGLY
jgi:hypothetical protein